MKYSFEVLNTTLPSWAFAPDSNPFLLNFEYVWGVKAAHSDVRTPICVVKPISALENNVSCRSDLAEVVVHSQLQRISFTVITQQISVSFVWPTSYVSDGQSNIFDPRLQLFKIRFGPYPVNEQSFMTLRNANVTLPRYPVQSQWMAFIGALTMPPFRTSLAYDPGSKISCLP